MSEQRSLFDQPAAPSDGSLDAHEWPKPTRFPLNRPGSSVRRLVFADLSSSRTPLIIAGYASLAMIVEFVASAPEAVERTRLLIGSEPTPGGLDHPTRHVRAVPVEAREYWLGNGFSILQCLNLVRAIERVKQGRVEARVLESTHTRLHAKIYLGDHAVTLGSSNFTPPGLDYQWEANARFESTERSRYSEARQIAEAYWESGKEYTRDLLTLLESLLRVVSWEEALARAALELMEGEWARSYLDRQTMPGDTALWPSQIAGIAQALWVIETTGSVLVADATGAGKTRLGAHLLRALADRSWRAGRVRSAYTLLVGPPAVKRPWEREATQAGTALRFRSHGQLSRRSTEDHESQVDEIRRAQVLAVDEAHNFLNPTSNRTRVLLGNLADHAVLFTATPINRGAVDLLRLADMLGADNLAPTTIKAFEKFLGARKITRTLTPKQIDLLKQELRRFTVRRTKRELNAWVARDPESYKDESGKRCRYPKHEVLTYELDESDEDRLIADEINQHAQCLRGVAYLRQPLEVPDWLRSEGWTEETWLNGRLRSAARLSAYQIRATLRSSPCALVEHIAGTAQALKEYGLSPADKKTTTGNVAGTLVRIRGNRPENRLTAHVPDWLTDPIAHADACDADREHYEAILEAARRLSSRRSDAKLHLIEKLAKARGCILAFDSRPITLAFLNSQLCGRSPGLKTIVATGERASARREAMRALSPRATHAQVAVLASDAMAEGINLQRASVVIHLDMPSVVRIAEQRVGRVDRMDSPHEVIEVYWPRDAEEFALRTDEKFIERYETVETLLGSNLPLPEVLTAGRPQVVTPEQTAAEAEADETSWDGIEDAFAPIRALISGDDALLSPAVLKEYRGISAQVLSRVAVLRSDYRWAFFCLAGTDSQAPRWLYVAADTTVDTRLDSVAEHLRSHLDTKPMSNPLTQRGIDWISDALARVQRDLPRLIPRRKQVALNELGIVLGAYHDQAAAAGDSDVVESLRRLREAIEQRDANLDWDAVANTWLEMVRPIWYEQLTAKRRNARPLLLRDIRRYLVARPVLPFADLVRAFDDLPRLPNIGARVAACIIGCPD